MVQIHREHISFLTTFQDEARMLHQTIRTGMSQSRVHDHTLLPLPLSNAALLVLTWRASLGPRMSLSTRHGLSWVVRAGVELKIRSSASLCQALRLLKKNA